MSSLHRLDDLQARVAWREGLPRAVSTEGTMVAVALTNGGTRQPGVAEHPIARADASLAACASAACASAACTSDAGAAAATPGAAPADRLSDTRPATGLLVAVLVSLPLWVAVFLVGRMLTAGF
jgi:hypothetical protein